MNTNTAKLFQERHQSIEKFRSLLVRKRQGHHTEVITREHLPAATLNARLAAAEKRSCIALSHGGSPCVEIAHFNCAECNAHCCQTHGPEHPKHEAWATEERLMTQQVRLQQAQQRPSSSSSSAPRRSSSVVGAVVLRCLASTEEDKCSDADLTCTDCGARICNLHGPEHGKHQYWATEQALARQTASSQAQNSSEQDRARAVVPQSSQAGVTESRNSAAAARRRRTSAAASKPKALSRMGVDELKLELTTVHGYVDNELMRYKTKQALKLLLRAERAEAQIVVGKKNEKKRGPATSSSSQTAPSEDDDDEEEEGEEEEED